MATVTDRPLRTIPKVPDFHQPRWFARLPVWVATGGFLLILIAASTFIRTRYINGQFWMDEAITTGIASHSLSAIPGILRHDGSPPLFYVLLHFWIQAFRRQRGGDAFAVAAVRIADDPGRDVGGLEPVRPAGRDVRGDAVRVQHVPDRVRRRDADVRADGPARADRHRRLHPRVHLPAPQIPDRVRARRGG